jgi:hypothetical protein
MNETNGEMNSQDDGDVTSASSSDPSIEPETSNRRELIERYGKYALVAAPLLLFASKARAIHSKP